MIFFACLLSPYNCNPPQNNSPHTIGPLFKSVAHHPNKKFWHRHYHRIRSPLTQYSNFDAFQFLGYLIEYFLTVTEISLYYFCFDAVILFWKTITVVITLMYCLCNFLTFLSRPSRLFSLEFHNFT